MRCRGTALAVALAALAAREGAGVKLPGTPVDPALLRCGNYTNLTHGKGFCEQYITVSRARRVCPLAISADPRASCLLQWPIVLFPGTDVPTIDRAYEDNFKTFTSMTTEQCAWQNKRFGCWIYYPKCEEVEVAGETFSLPSYPCNEVCTFTLQNCTDVYDAISSMGNMIDYLSMCGDGVGGLGGEAEQRYNQPPDLLGVRSPQAIITTGFPAPLQGQSPFPRAKHTYQLKGEAVEVQCVDPNHASGGEVFEFAGCDYAKGMATPWVDPADNMSKCHITCPHPLYTAPEYTTQRLFYLVPGWIGGLLNILLVIDAIVSWNSVRPECKTAKKSSMLHFQLVGGIIGVIYLVLGPVFTTFGDISCPDGAAIPNILTPSWVPSEKLTCTLSRAAIYASLAMLNVLIVTLAVTVDRLGKSTTIGAKHISSRKINACMTIGVSDALVKAVLMYSLDHLDPKAGEYQGQIARWTVVCGPRLTVLQEMALVHAPLILCKCVLLNPRSAAIEIRGWVWAT
jgi:hypothetical protein